LVSTIQKFSALIINQEIKNENEVLPKLYSKRDMSDLQQYLDALSGKV